MVVILVCGVVQRSTRRFLSYKSGKKIVEEKEDGHCRKAKSLIQFCRMRICVMVLCEVITFEFFFSSSSEGWKKSRNTMARSSHGGGSSLVSYDVKHSNLACTSWLLVYAARIQRTRISMLKMYTLIEYGSPTALTSGNALIWILSTPWWSNVRK